MTLRVLITGGQGLVGKALAERMLTEGLKVRVSSRQNIGITGLRLDSVQITDLASKIDWLPTLEGVGTVVHCAARVHVMRDTEAAPLTAFRAVNVEGTLNLARQSAVVGVKRFVFISSVKVNGEFTLAARAFTEADAPNPEDAYGLSKHEAELGLRKISIDTGMEVVIIRPPLVYGPGVKANFAALLHAVQRGWPLPLGRVYNRRSLVGLDNLVDFIITCSAHPQAANETFLVSDGHDLSTTELARGMARAAGVPERLVSVPVWALQAGAMLVGKGDAVQRLCGNLQVDISKGRNLLSWTPPFTVAEGLRRVVSGKNS